MTEVEFLRRELERQLKAVDDLNKMVKDLSQITFESKMDKWLKASKAKEWVGLTEDEMFDCLVKFDPVAKRLPLGFKWFAEAIEAKLRERNT